MNNRKIHLDAEGLLSALVCFISEYHLSIRKDNSAVKIECIRNRNENVGIF